MSIFLLVLKIVTVGFFLLMFIRTGRLAWAVGLLTVTSAILLDAFLGTFGREEMVDELGFFFFVIAGGLFSGATAWLWMLLRPYPSARGNALPGGDTATYESIDSTVERETNKSDAAGAAVDRKMLFDQIRERLSPDDILDVIFDLGMTEHEVVGFHQDANQVILRLIDLAEQKGLSGQLALSVERILSPLRREEMPRPEKLSVDTPPMVLRHYLLANVGSAELETMAGSLGVDWEYLPGADKKAKARNLLLYVQRRNRLHEIIDLIQELERPQSAQEQAS